MSESLVVRYCAPTLAGIKTGNLFNCAYKSVSDFYRRLERIQTKLESKGIKIFPLRFSNNRVLIYVYRSNRLEADLKDKMALEILSSYGYSTDYVDINEFLIRLKTRINEASSFPHEIGLFLGYPPIDVNGFIINGGKGSKCTGCWKVYGDEKRAIELFHKYKECTRCYGEKWLQGKSINDLAVAI